MDPKPALKSTASAGTPVPAPRPDMRGASEVATAASQPFRYPLEQPFEEPDWTRIPGFRGASRNDWESALWQRKHTLKNLKELKAALGDFLPEDLAASIDRDQRERATMSILVTPQMVNTMDLRDLWSDPVRRYMLPAFADRRTDWPNHPRASRDSLHEAEMWVVEGLTHRYPTKVLAEVLSTCPQYCGHCTRMDLVGNDVPQVDKKRFVVPQQTRYQQILDYLKRTRLSSRRSWTFPTSVTFVWPPRASWPSPSTSSRTRCWRVWNGWRRRPGCMASSSRFTPTSTMPASSPRSSPGPRTRC
jgi:hypothetical protein